MHTGKLRKPINRNQYVLHCLFKCLYHINCINLWNVPIKKQESQNISSCKTYIRVRKPLYGHSMVKQTSFSLAKELEKLEYIQKCIMLKYIANVCIINCFNVYVINVICHMFCKICQMSVPWQLPHVLHSVSQSI